MANSISVYKETIPRGLLCCEILVSHFFYTSCYKFYQVNIALETDTTREDEGPAFTCSAHCGIFMPSSVCQASPQQSPPDLVQSNLKIDLAN